MHKLTKHLALAGIIAISTMGCGYFGLQETGITATAPAESKPGEHPYTPPPSGDRPMDGNEHPSGGGEHPTGEHPS